MGSSSSKLKKKLNKGDESSALALFDANKDLQKKFDANVSYGERYNLDTPLHLASRHAMKRALRFFLFDYGGNPNKRNGKNETSLHCACQLRYVHSPTELAAREECVTMLVEWRGSRLGDGSHEKLDIASQDKIGNTALHYAAQSGFLSCVKLLVELNAPLFTENDERQTPCELAEQASMYTIAQFLESKMVFYDNDDVERTITPEPVIDQGMVDTATSASNAADQDYQGLRPQQLQEAKDTLIVETSDMLRVPLFTAEVLLRHHEWSREVLLEAWIQDAVSCCEKSGVTPPANLDDSTNAGDHELNIMKAITSKKNFEEISCGICFDDINESEEVVAMLCDHQFCQDCWKDYLDIKIKEGDAHNIVCPAFDCNKLVPVEFIETTVSTKMAQRYLQFDIKAFVASNPRILWCPHPGCGQAVQNPEKAARNRSASVTSRTSQEQSRPTEYQSLAAHCSNGHTFCWSCQFEPHDPATCDHYKSWLEKIIQMKKDELSDVSTKSETAANVFWMLSNSKKCPHCKSPIEKNEGCNHMRCSKCKHDFCWVCLEPWKWHNSMTGGFFRCTRYEVVEKVDEAQQNEITAASEKHKALQELNKFVHYYSRYENHKHSLELEKPLLNKAKQKMSQLVDSHIHQSASTSSASHNMNTAKRLTAARFIEEAITVLIKARHTLQFGYVYGYYLQDTSIKRMVFELLQTELEEKTEYLSEIIARPYLRTPKAQIIKTTKQVSEKTEEFLTAISNGLLPQDLPQVDHSSAAAGTAAGTSASSAAWLSDSDDSTDEAGVRRGICKAANCNKPKLKHSGLGDQHHEYCSVACLKADYMSRSKRKAKSQGKNKQIDLLQALEMSRLQLLQDMDSLNTTGSSSDLSVEDESVSLRRSLGINMTELPADPILEHVLRLSQSFYAEEQDEDLNLAIEMSMQSDEVQRRMMQERAANRRQRAHSHTESLDGTSSLTPALITPNVDTQASTEQQQSTPEQDDDRRRDSEIERELYRARLEELDNAIAELLESRPDTSADSSLRRTESERESTAVSAAAQSSNSSRSSVRRTRSERRTHHRQLHTEH